MGATPASRSEATAACGVNGKEAEEHIFRSNVPTVPFPDDLTLPEFVLHDAEKYADKVALVEAFPGGSEYTYGQVLKETRSFAMALTRIGIRKGHVVVVVLPNMALYPVVALGIMAAGGVFSGANPLAVASEIEKQVHDSEAKLIVTTAASYDKVKHIRNTSCRSDGKAEEDTAATTSGFIPVIIVGEPPCSATSPNATDEEGAAPCMIWADLLESADSTNTPSPPRSEHNGTSPPPGVLGTGITIQQTDLCALPYSSGTTGASKGVMLTHRNLVANLCSTLYSVREEMIGQVTTLGLMPFFHIYGITGICCATLRNKGKVVVMPRFDLRTFVDALIRHEVHFAPIVPPIMLAMVKSPMMAEFDLSGLNLKAVMTAAAPMAPELRAAFEEKFPGVVVQEAYGLTEHSCITLTHGENGASKKDSVGFVLPNIEVKFVDPETGKSLPRGIPGEICVRSQCVMQGYYKNVEETNRTVDSQGWLHTGDIGYIDEDGDVFVVDRIKELIKYKGFQVAPAELEALLLAHPSVQDAAVFPLPDEEAGEIPSACVVMTTGATESEDDMMRYVASNVASYKKVRVLRFVDAIPKSPSGKILRRVLKENMIKLLATNPKDK